MATIGSLNILIGASTAGLARGLSSAAGMVSGFVSSTQSALSSLADLSILGVSLSDLFSPLLGPISLAAEAEQTQTAFEVMLGDAEQARKLIAQINEFAAVTPFETPELLASTRKLLSFNVAAEDVTAHLKVLGDVAAGAQVPIGDLTTIFGQIKAAGRVMTEDFNQISQRAPAFSEALAKAANVGIGELRDKMEKGQITFAHFATAMNSLTGEGGKFANMMEKQSATLNGVWSTVKDNFGMALTQIGVMLIEGFDLKGMANRMGDFTGWLRANVDKLRPIFLSTGQVVKALFDTVVAAVKPLSGFVGPLVDAFYNSKVTAEQLRTGALDAFEAVAQGINYARNASTSFAGVFVRDVAARIVAEIAAIANAFAELTIIAGRATAQLTGDTSLLMAGFIQKNSAGTLEKAAEAMRAFGNGLAGTDMAAGSDVITAFFDSVRNMAAVKGQDAGKAFAGGIALGAGGFEKLEADLKKLVEGNQSPLFAFAKQMNKFRQMGDIANQFGADPKFAAGLDRAMAGAFRDIEDRLGNNEVGGVSALTQGSQAAASAILKAQRQKTEDPQAKVERVLREMKQLEERQAKADEEIARLLRNGDIFKQVNF